MEKLIKPNQLKKGDVIGIVSPSSPLAGLLPHRVEKGIKMIESLGYKAIIGKNALKINNYTSGTPKERADDINNFFKDKEVKAIFSFIGGNHSNQLLEYLDFELFKKNPKIFLGYSDATVLHFAFYTQAKLITFYGPAVLTQFAETPNTLPYTEKYFKKALTEAEPIGEIECSARWTDHFLDWFEGEDLKQERMMKKNKGWEWIKKGKGDGRILGGCISSMIHLRGTKYWPDFRNKIFFWEIPESDGNLAEGESPEKIDSYLTDLELTEVFKKIRGMVIGRPFGYTGHQTDLLKEIIRQRTKRYHFPILFGVDIGHTDPMITVPLGVKAELSSKKNLFYLSESGVKRYEK